MHDDFMRTAATATTCINQLIVCKTAQHHSQPTVASPLTHSLAHSKSLTQKNQSGACARQTLQLTLSFRCYCACVMIVMIIPWRRGGRWCDGAQQFRPWSGAHSWECIHLLLNSVIVGGGGGEWNRFGNNEISARGQGGSRGTDWWWCSKDKWHFVRFVAFLDCFACCCGKRGGRKRNWSDKCKFLPVRRWWCTTTGDKLHQVLNL